MKDLSAASPREVFRDRSALERYEEVRQPVLGSLIELNTNSHVIRALFDRGRFGSDVVQLLFGWLARNLFRYNIVIAHRLWNDPDARAVTLKRLRAVVMEGARPEWKSAIRQALREAGLDPETEQILRRVAGARNTLLAHVQDPQHFNPLQPGGGVNIVDLERVGAQLGRLYNAMYFGGHQTFVLVNLMDGGGLGLVRDLLAAHSNDSEFFDKHEGWWWRNVRPRLTSDDIAELNRVRKVAGMRPIPSNPPNAE